MTDRLETVLERIGVEFREDILENSRFYREVDIGREAGRLGFAELRGRYQDVYAIVPLKRPIEGMKVRIDGRTFVDYAQLDSGVVVPGYVVRETRLPFRPFWPNDSMILNFA
jgi:hypothetical protein